MARSAGGLLIVIVRVPAAVVFSRNTSQSLVALMLADMELLDDDDPNAVLNAVVLYVPRELLGS